MKNKDIFDKYFKHDPNSPTKFVWVKSGKAAGNKHKQSGRGSNNLLTLGTVEDGKSYCWSLNRVLFEVYNGFEPDRSLFVVCRDGNKENLTRSNLVLSSFPR